MTSGPEDQSKWREIEELVRRSEGMAVAGRFAVAIMHEINNPLEAVANLNYLIQHDAENPENIRKYSRLIDEQLRTLGKLARQTLSFYRSAETRQAVAISSLAEAALRVHEKNISAKRIQLLKRLPEDITAEVHPGDILQVFSNLVANAVDALPVNGTLRLRVKRCPEHVHITVADNGPGIPDPILKRIFEPFFTTKKEHGTGLGLAISKTIVEKHQGRIKSRSSTVSEKSGTIFRISLPVIALSSS